jgi:hypothetical protein
MLLPEILGVPPPCGEARVEVDPLGTAFRKPLPVSRGHARTWRNLTKRQNRVAAMNRVYELSLDGSDEVGRSLSWLILIWTTIAANGTPAGSGAQRAGRLIR